MSSERIDLTKDGLRKSIREHEKRYYEPTIEDVETILSCLEGIDLIAELKRCYEEIDDMLKEIDMLRSGHIRCPGCNEWMDTNHYDLSHQTCY